MRLSRLYIHHKVAALSDYEGQLRLESARIEKAAEMTFEAFRFLRSKSKYETPWRYGGTISKIHTHTQVGKTSDVCALG